MDYIFSILIYTTKSDSLRSSISSHAPPVSDDKNNIDQAVSLFKPPVFWKDKPLITQQIRSWRESELKTLIYKTSEMEYLIKKNSSVAKNLLSDFIINNSKKINN